MRLLVKTSLLIITVSIFIFLIWNIVFFQIARQMIMKQVDSELNTVMHNVMHNLNTSQLTPHNINILDFVEIEHVSPNLRQLPVLRDTLIFNKFQKKYIPHRILIFTYNNGTKNHLVSIQKSLLETDLVIEKITLVLVVLIFDR